MVRPTASRSAASSKGRTVGAYSTLTSSASAAARTLSSIGPTAITTPLRPSRTVWKPGPRTGRGAVFDCWESRTYTLSSPAA